MDDAGLRPTEERLRSALRTRAERIDPPDRFEDVLEAATSAGRARRWVPVAAAAAVAALVGGLWVAHPGAGPDDRTDVATTTSASPTTAPTASPSTTPSRTPTPTATPSTRRSSTPVATATPTRPAAAPLPVYVIAPEVPQYPDGRFGLRRVWTPTTATSAQERVRLAVRATLDAWPTDLRKGPKRPDPRVLGVDIAADGAVVTLSAPPRVTATAADDLALPAIGWTTQAVLGRGNLPVTVRANGTTLGVETRPAADGAYRQLADVWITSPAPDAVLEARGHVVVRGEASVFEAALTWDLSREGAHAGGGSTTASVGAPGRGTYEIDLGRLPPDVYRITVQAASPKDGSPLAQDVLVFTVR